MSRRVAGLILLVTFVIGSLFVPENTEAQTQRPQHVPNSYIVVYKDAVSNTRGKTDDLVQRHGLTKKREFSHALKGFTATIPVDKLDKVQKDPQVAYVVENRYVTVAENHGLQSTYFNNADFTRPVLKRVDPIVHFNWGHGSPAASIQPDTFSVRWIGQVQPIYSEKYTFYVKTTDPVRLWVNGKLLIGNSRHKVGELTSIPIVLTRFTKYDIKLEFVEDRGSASVTLGWQSRSQTKQIIPVERLFTVVEAPTPKPTPSLIPSPSPTTAPSPIPTPTPVPSPSASPFVTDTVPSGVSRIGGTRATTGSGVGIAIIDTGIDPNHPDLVGNITALVNCVDSTQPVTDGYGHGTHIAGIAAASKNGLGVVGVAPESKLIVVKVMDDFGQGTWDSVICGIDWVTANASQYNIKVANVSLVSPGVSDNNCGFTNWDPLHTAFCRSRDAGVTYVVAAGNSWTDASGFVPGSYDDAVIAVSALADSDGLPGGFGSGTGMGNDDTFTGFSNFGSVVDLGAPGTTIFSTSPGGGYAYRSGTSVAAPHVAGAAALYIATHPLAKWTEVRDALKLLGEPLGAGHTDPSEVHPEPVVLTTAF